MANILSGTPSPNDLSNQVLAELLGNNWWDNTVTQSGFLYDFTIIMNTIMLSLGVLMMVYGVATATISTAHEGTPLGNRLNTIWVPLRAALGVSILAPIYHGLSVLQVAILAVVTMSISGANHITGLALDKLTPGVTEIIAQNPQIHDNTVQIAGIVLQNRIAQQYGVATGWPLSADGVYITTTADNLVKYQFTSNPGTGHDVDMGHLEVCADDNIVCKTRQAAIVAMIERSGPIADNIVRLALAMEGWGAIPDNTLDSLVKPYVANVTAAISTYSVQQRANFSGSDFIVQTRTDGWMGMGTVYWQYSRLSASISNVINNLPSATPYTDESYGISQSIPGAEIAQAYWLRHKETTHFDHEDMSITDIRSFSGAQKYVRTKINSYVDPMLESASDALTRGDIIQNLSMMGHHALISAEALVGFAALAQGLSSGVSQKGVVGGVLSALPFGSIIDTAISTIGAGIALIIKAMAGAAFALFGIGMSLAYYLPAIPVIYWISGTITWVVGVIETLIAAPVWAIGHILVSKDGGHGLIASSAINGYYMLANLFLRPVLMVVGMILSILLVKVAGAIINAVYIRYILQGMLADQTHGPLSIIAVLGLLVIIVLAAAHQIFSLITTLPNMVMSHINPAMPSDQTRQQVEGAGGRFAAVGVATGAALSNGFKKIGGK